MKLLHDAFSRTYRPAAAEAQIPTATANRHATVLRRCAGTRDTVTVVAHGRVALTLLNLLHTADLDVEVTATATPRRSG